MYKHFLVISNYSARVLQSQYLIVQPPFYFDWDQVCVGLLQHDAASQKEKGDCAIWRDMMVEVDRLCGCSEEGH